MMEEAGVDFILTEREHADKLKGLHVRLTDCEICGLETPASERTEAQDPDAPAYVLYTSGTTGRPKGVCVTNRNVCHYVRAFKDEDGLSCMTAYVVPASQDMRVSAVRKELSENLTAFMIPEFIVKMPQIPLNTNGKPDVSRLPVVMKAGIF